MKVHKSWWTRMNVGKKQMKVDGDAWKLVPVDESGGQEQDERGWKKVKEDEKECKWMKVNESGWTLMKLDERRQKWEWN